MEVVAISQPPDWLRLVGLAAFDGHEFDIPVAHLELDTTIDGPGDVRRRLLRFSAGSHAVEVTVTPKPRTATLTVTVTPPGTVAIEVHPLHGAVRQLRADATGVATCHAVPSGPLSIVVLWPHSQGGSIRTAWTQV